LAKKIQQETWIGMAEVKPRRGHTDLGRAKGAIVIVLALAKSIKSYDEIVCKFLNKWGFDVLEISDIEPFKERLAHSKVNKSLLALEKKLSKTNPVIWDTFFCYMKG
jgi:hypothetical protein